MTKQMQRRIRERWCEIMPALLIEARRYAMDPAQQVRDWRQTHALRVEMLLARGVRLRKVRVHGWDDPRVCDREFFLNIARAVENLKKRTRRPPLGLDKFTRKHVPSTTGGNDVTNGT